MGAASGRVQRNSGRSKDVPRFEWHVGRRGRKAWSEGVVLGRIAGGEGRVSKPEATGNSGRSEEGRVSKTRVESCSVTAAQWLSVDSGAASAFPVNLVARRVPVGPGLSDATTLVKGSP